MMGNKSKPFYKIFPKTVIMEITTKCNLSCSYCAARILIKKPADLGVEKVKFLAERLNMFQFDFITLCGMGEPLVHQDFYQVLELLNFKLIVVTNGSVPIDYQRLTKTGNVHIITFSVDGASAESLQKISANYNRNCLLKNLDGAAEYGVNIAFNVTLSPYNLEELEGILELGRKYKIVFLKLCLPLGQEKWVRQNITAITSLLFGITNKAKKYNLPVEGPFERKCTYAGAPSALLLSNGDFYPCCDYYSRRPVVGNLFRSSLLELWENKTYNDFRNGRFCMDCKLYHNRLDLLGESGIEVSNQ